MDSDPGRRSGPVQPGKIPQRGFTGLTEVKIFHKLTQSGLSADLEKGLQVSRVWKEAEENASKEDSGSIFMTKGVMTARARGGLS